VILLLESGTRRVLLEKGVKDDDCEFTGEVRIGPEIPAGQIIFAVMIRKGEQLIPLSTESGGRFESLVTVTGKFADTGRK
jgi:hypothetical protein